MRWFAAALALVTVVVMNTTLYAGPLYDEGETLYEDEAYKKASGLLKKSFKKERDTRSDAALLLSRCYERMGKMDRAVDTLKDGRAGDPENWQILYRLGELQEKKGDRFGALDAFYQASAVKPDDMETAFRLGMAYDSTAQMEQALKVYRKLKKANSPYAKRLLNAIQGIE